MPDLITIPTISISRVEDVTRRTFIPGALASAFLIACGDDDSVGGGDTQVEVAVLRAENPDLVCLQELTLSPYFAITPDDQETAAAAAEDVESGPTAVFARAMAAVNGATRPSA